MVEIGDLVDPALDAWIERFDLAHPVRQPLHGDFYPGNILAKGDALVGLVDWDEAFVGPPERELAWAAWEWGNGLRSLDLGLAMAFVADYQRADGPSGVIDETVASQLVRERLRWEMQYGQGIRDLQETQVSQEDIDYLALQRRAYFTLAP